jgi:putative phosphoribosyl transferase
MGAIASGGVLVFNNEVLSHVSITENEFERVAAREQRELEHRERMYRGTRAPVEVRNKTVLLVDDGIATGTTMRSAIEALKARSAAKIVIAAPIASHFACEQLCADGREMCVCLVTPEEFFAVGVWYENFEQTTDDEVRHLLALAGNPQTAASSN